MGIITKETIEINSIKGGTSTKIAAMGLMTR